ncbi:MAG: hypothetical protein ACRDRH_20070 [Pseudonocardia sp.]
MDWYNNTRPHSAPGYHTPPRLNSLTTTDWPV